LATVRRINVEALKAVCHMDWKENSKLWNENAEAWTCLARQGRDVTRDNLNTPAFLSMLPEVKGLHGLDMGCGEANNTRLVAKRGATMCGIDASEVFIQHSIQAEKESPLGIDFQIASAHQLPYADSNFDFVMATMFLMDVPEPLLCIREAFRVLKSGGFFQFSITHPCFQTRRWEWIKENDKKVGVICGDYFEGAQGQISSWTFTSSNEEEKTKFEKFKVPTFYWTLSEWLNWLIDTGFNLEKFCEPTITPEIISKHPGLAGWDKIAGYLHVRCRKP
jgi:ubiquinone/menaquinone biosynthesis C-methylase UbiE